MIFVTICGKKSDINVSNTIKKVLYSYNNKYFNNKFIVKESEKLPLKSSKQKEILVFKNSYHFNNDNINLNNFIPIFDSKNHEAIKILTKEKNSAISCGMSVKDTLSISSLDFSRAIISLQREILNIYCKKIEPREFKIKINEKIGVYPLLSTSAILLLSDISNLNEFSFY